MQLSSGSFALENSRFGAWHTIFQFLSVMQKKRSKCYIYWFYSVIFHKVWAKKNPYFYFPWLKCRIYVVIISFHIFIERELISAAKCKSAAALWFKIY